MNMIRKMVGIVACALMLQASVALAENRAETFTFNPYAGGVTFDDDGGPGMKNFSPTFGLRLGYNLTDNWALEGGAGYIKGRQDGGGSIDMVRFGGDLLYNFMPKNSFVPYLAAGFGGFDAEESKVKGMWNYGAGAKWFFTENAALRGDVRALHYTADSSIKNNLEYTLGLHFAVGAPKPAPKPVEVAPVVVAPVDSDGDGVIDGRDNCPDTPKGVSVNAEGCPLDSDKDGVYDYQDSCPGTPLGVKVDAKGCPLDSDGDGVYDYLDKCPGTPQGVKVDQDGCAPKVVESTTQKAVVAGTRLDLKVQFDTGKSLIKKQYYDELKAVGDALNQDKTLKGTIEGYTDSVGNDKLNQQLSQRRANAVRDYIIKNFKVDGKRLTAKGYGEANPVADNGTAAGRAQNRRIEAVFE
jgi:OOP family OmpA-OmpF porin